MTVEALEVNLSNMNADQLITCIKTNIRTLPATEFNYYIALLLASIKNESHPENYLELLKKIAQLIVKINLFYSNNDPKVLTHAIDELIETSQMQTISHSIKRALLGICGVLFAILTSFIGGAAGLTVGFLSNYNIIGNIKGAGLGFISGFVVGFLVGYRAPTKLLQKNFDTKIEFCTDNLKRLRDEFEHRSTFEQYKIQTKNYIIETFFKNVPNAEKEQQFNEFLNSQQEYQICTTSAGHISKSLKGYMGHHALIQFEINGKKDRPIEFGERKKTPRHVDQSETTRQVTGQKLFEMLILDQRLQDTHQYNLSNALRIYSVGNDDCRTYIDKILIGTGQEPTKIGRFSENDTFIGRRVTVPLISFFSKTNQNELFCLIEKPDDEQFKITHHKYTLPSAQPQ